MPDLDLASSAMAFIAGSGWIEPLEAARELVNLTKAGCEWPKATKIQWTTVFNELVAEGKLELRDDGTIGIPLIRDAAPVAVQMGLFE